MDTSNLADGLTYRGEFKSVRQTYSIFETRDCYFVLSSSPSKANAGNFNIVGKKSVEYTFGRFAGKKNVTAKAVVEQAKRTKHAPDSLAALNVLYVLGGIGMATHKIRGPHKELRFSMKKGKPSQSLHLINKA